MNKTVNVNEINGFKLLVKSVSNSKLLTTLSALKSDWNQTTNEVVFTIPDGDFKNTKLKIGQYYKIQLAYTSYQEGDSQETIGYYSSVGVVKYTARPIIGIEGLSFISVNMNENIFVGYYSSKDDPSERVYTYQFDVYRKDGSVYDTSGECLHNSFEDDSPYESRDTFTLNKDLDMNETFYVQYHVTTTNKIKLSSSKFLIMQKDTINPELRADVLAMLNRDNGYIKVQLVGKKDTDGIESAAIGSFVLKRASSKDNYGVWQTIYQFKLNGQLPSSWSWKDMTIEHGYKYKYALQQYSDYLTSNKIESNEVYAEFEDSFLYDGHRQLKIKYNPKISSFKTTLQETKLDTMGSKYPFFFRNGNVYYKEFPISGLISYHSDEESLFIPREELLLNEEYSINLTDNNIAAERIFKTTVLDWLNNGEAKIFKSPNEGNFIVRLLNTSLAPVDTLGRMLHSFSTTAYEIAEFNYDTITDLGFISLQNIQEDYVTRWETVNLYPYNANTILPLNYPLTSFIITDAIPGTQFKIRVQGAAVSNPITIGTTGMYKIDLADNIKIDQFIIVSPNNNSGTIMYSYESSAQNVFDTITDVQINDWIFAQYIGEYNDVIGVIEEKTSYTNDKGALVTFQGLKKELLGLKYLQFYKRALYTLYEFNGLFYWDSLQTNHISLNDLDPTCVYQVIKYIDEETQETYYLDGQTQQVINNYSNTFTINGTSQIDLTETESFELPTDFDIDALALGSGIIFQCAYQTKEITYSLEVSNKEIAKLKALYIQKTNKFYEALHNENIIDTKPYYIEMMNSHKEFLIALHKELEKQKEDTGYYV